MAVLSQSGLAGRVIAVSPHYSVAQTILNKDFRAGARIQRSRVDCIVEWTGGEGIELKNISKKQDVRTGDVVETSGFSSLFPPGIVVGTVTSVTEPPGSLFKEVEAALSTNFATLEQVFIVLQPGRPQSAASRTTRSHLALMNRYVKYGIVSIVLIVVQTTLIQLLNLEGIMPDILAIWVVYIAIAEGQMEGMPGVSRSGSCSILPPKNLSGFPRSPKCSAAFSPGIFTMRTRFASSFQATVFCSSWRSPRFFRTCCTSQCSRAALK